ncbi:hypothetical protein V498_06202 [Pseudogymnoascus sp. VKM F-4517 (FW-2822)]|nr:hypothetical protein V498_06202 [Pseudogymnoascus sp. VKM F-4517 (FW-2822)]
MFGMITCCFGFDWFIVMLQHSRIRATYNIDGTAGGDCVQSLFCSRCTLMQDEWEVVAREERILLERKETEVNRQPGQQQQMRYSTSNLLEEVPEVFRPVAVSGRKIEPVPRVSTPNPGEQETNVDQPLLQDVDHQEHTQTLNKGLGFHNKPRQSGHNSRKLAVRKSSPIGSALNPIIRRSSSFELRGRSSDSKLPQRSATNPARPATLVSPVRYTSPNLLNYRSKAKGSYGVLEMPAGSKEEAKSEDFNPSIHSDVGVKSFALCSVYSGSSLRQGHSDGRADESVIVYYGHEDRPQHHRLSDFPQSRPLTPEPIGPQVDTLDGVAGRLESVDKDNGNGAECNCGLNTRQADAGECGDHAHAEELFAQLSTPTPALRRFSISPSEMEEGSSNVQAPNSTLEAMSQIEGVKPRGTLGRAVSLIRYLVDVDKFLNIPTGQTKFHIGGNEYLVDVDKFLNIPTGQSKDSSNIPTARSNDPSNDSFKSIIEISRGSDVVEEEGVVVDYLPRGLSDLLDNVSDDVAGGAPEGVNSPVAEDIIVPETSYRLQHGESSSTNFTDPKSKALDSIADDWIEVSSPETLPIAGLRAPEQSPPAKDLLSDDCDFVSAEQQVSDVYHVAHETMEVGHMVVLLTPEISREVGDLYGQESCTTPHGAGAELTAQSATWPDEPIAAETTTQSQEPTTAASPSNTDVKDQSSNAATDLLDSTSHMTDTDKNPRGMRQRSKKSRNRRNRKRRAAVEAAKAES